MGDCLPHVSVVVPVRNGEQSVEPCIRSLLDLDYPDEKVEIFMVDDGSTDRTAALIKQLPVEYRFVAGEGAYAARNAGIACASGDAIAFTDADCVVSSGWLRNLLVGYDDRQTGCFAGEIESLTPVTLVQEYFADLKLFTQKALLSMKVPGAATANVAYRRAVFDEIGLFDGSLESGGDTDLCWRMQYQTGYKVNYTSRAVVYHRHPASLLKLLRRCYRQGKGVAKARLRYPENYGPQSTSLARNCWHVLLLCLSFVKYPLKALEYCRARYPRRKCLAYPLYDKLSMLTYSAGAVRMLASLKRKQHGSKAAP